MKRLVSNVQEIQKIAMQLYGKYDKKESLIWMTEEFGEVVSAIHKKESIERISSEFGDLLAWVFCFGNILGFDVLSAIEGSFIKEVERQKRVYGKMKYASDESNSSMLLKLSQDKEDKKC